MLVKVTEETQRSINGMANWDKQYGEFYVEQFTPLQNDLLAIIGKSELLADMPLLPVAEDIGELTCLDME